MAEQKITAQINTDPETRKELLKTTITTRPTVPTNHGYNLRLRSTRRDEKYAQMHVGQQSNMLKGWQSHTRTC